MKKQIKRMKCVNNNHTKSLTLSKEYPVIDITENKFLIIDDNGVEKTFYQGRFEEVVN